MAVQDYKINYKSDFVLTINGDAGWTTQFCIKFWTGMPSQAYFVGFDGVKYINCRVGDTPTQLLVMFDDHHLPIGKLKMQIAYHTTIEEFPGSVFDEVTNARDVIVTIDGTDYQVLLDFTGEDAPELEFNLPAYANEAERIQNELQRQQNEADRIAAELQREQATTAAVQGAENVNAQLNGTTLTVTNRNGVSTSVNTKGEQGEQGPVGPEGPQGQKGVSVTGLVKTGETDTDTLYNVTFSDGTTQAVAIPKGAKGDTGATGPTGPQGPQGQTGVSITGLVKTGETETATLYNITFSNGTTQQVAIPKGEKGDQGEQGPEGPQGPMGDVAVITPEQQAAFTMYSVPGQNTKGPMTQKAVTDALGNIAASGVSYDNSQSGLAATNVQEAVDEIQESVKISPLCYDDSVDSDLDIGDINGNILAMFANGDVIVKNFHSGNIGRFPQFSESNPYVIGDYCTYNSIFYKFTSAHLGAWDEADVERVTVLDLTDKQIYPVDFNEYDLGFEDEYGNVLVKFAGGHIYTKYFNSETAAQGRPYPPLNLYRLNKKTYEDIVTSWTEGADYITSTDTGVSGGLKLNRQYAMLNRQLVYDFSLASGSSACFGTKVGIARGQYMGTDDFIRIGTDGNIQTFTYNQYSSATATKNIGTATITADTRYRLIIDKCGEWNKDKTKITILTFDLLEIVFETELLQSANNNLSFYDYPFCFCESGTVKLYDLCVKVSNVCHNRKLAIFGDSITEGWMAGVDGWAHLVARHIGKAFCQVSGRDTTRIDDVIARVRAECASNPPQYIMVTIGTNSGNTLAKLQSLIDLILSYNSIPILNHVSSPASANSLIDQAIASYPNTFIGCCKMDEAVALGDSYSGTDGTHPNATGHNLMYQQVIKDMPELFD